MAKSEAEELLAAVRSEAFEAGRKKGYREGLDAARRALEESVNKIFMELRFDATAPEPGTELTLESPISALSVPSNLKNAMFMITRGNPLTYDSPIGALVQLSASDLLDVRGIGTKSLYQIQAMLERHGFALAKDRPQPE